MHCGFSLCLFGAVVEGGMSLPVRCHWQLMQYKTLCQQMWCRNALKYTVVHKNVALCFCPYLCQLLTNFQNFLTGTPSEQCDYYIYFTTPQMCLHTTL